MASVSHQPEPLLTVEEFAARPDPGHPEELVRGRILTMPPPRARHGQVCGRISRLLGSHAEDHDLGHVLSNDTGIITGRGPDSVRGPDIAFIRYVRLPRGPLPDAYLDVPPDLVIEVRSPEDRWPSVLAKAAEYLEAGVGFVGVLDPEARSMHLFRAEQPVQILGEDDELAIPEILGDFRVTIRRLLD